MCVYIYLYIYIYIYVSQRRASTASPYFCLSIAAPTASGSCKKCYICIYKHIDIYDQDIILMLYRYMNTIQKISTTLLNPVYVYIYIYIYICIKLLFLLT